MPSFGDFNGFPYEFGDDPSSEEAIFGMLRRACGEGFAADDTIDVTTIDGLWFAAQAAGLAAIESTEEAAHWQGFPSTATDELAGYEESLGIVPAIDAGLEERRAEVVAAWTERIAATYPTLIEIIFSMTSDILFFAPRHLKAATTIAGKVYDPIGAPGTFHEGRRCSNWPNFSDDHVVAILINIPSGSLPNVDQGKAKIEIEALLDAVLPAWNDYRVLSDFSFTLDSSLLDVTGFGS